MKPYDELVLMPHVIAQTVCGQPYTGHEMSDRIRSAQDVREVEELRQQMTGAQIADFIDVVDKVCRRAYDNRYAWFLKCVKEPARRRGRPNYNENAGRDQLYIWVSHWMNSYLRNPKRMREQVLSGVHSTIVIREV